MRYMRPLILLALCSAAFAVPQTISIPGESSTKAKTLKPVKSEAVLLVGTIDIIPMGGAQVVLRSNNSGQDTLLPQSQLPAADLSQIERWANQRSQVQVQGTMLTICSARELKRDIIGCRAMDRSKSMTLTKQ